jgi:hypothetical protein
VNHHDGSPALLYLDLNHWVGLAKARLQLAKCPEPYRAMYPVLERLTSAGRIVTPLSAVHYAETRDRIANPRQRNDVALTMAELSRYRASPPRELLLHEQLRSAIADRLAVATDSVPPMSRIGHGVGFAQRGVVLNGRLHGPELPTAEPGAMTNAALSKVEEWVGGGWRFSGRDQMDGRLWREAVTNLFNEAAEFVILRGPADRDVPALRNLGYDPEALAELMTDVAAREQRMKAVLMSKPQAERRPDDVVGAAALSLDGVPQLIGQILSELHLSHTAWGELTKTDMEAIVDATPILDIERRLRVGRLKNADYRIDLNDLYDMAALGVAVSSCDVVATDRSAAHMLRAAGADHRYGCTIVGRPSELLRAVTELERSAS